MKRFFKISLLSLFAILIILAITASAFIFTEKGRLYLIKTALAELAKSGTEVDLTGLQTQSLGAYQLSEFSVSTKGEKIVSGKNIIFSFEPLALLSKKIEVNNISASELVLYTVKTPTEEQAKKTSDAPAFIPIEVKNISVGSFKFLDAEDKQLVDFNLNGNLQLTSFESSGINFNITADNNLTGERIITLKTTDSARNKKLLLTYNDSTPLLIDKFTPKKYFDEVALNLEIELLDKVSDSYPFVISNSYLQLDDEKIGIKGQLALNPEKGEITFTNFTLLTTGDRPQTINGTFSKTAVDVQVDLEKFSLSMLNLFLPQDIAGNVSSNIKLQGTYDKPNASGDIDLDSTIYNVPLTVKTSFAFSDNIISITELGLKYGRNYINSSGNYNAFEKNGDFKISSSFKTADLPQALLDDYNINLINAILTTDVKISGSPEKPAINGLVDFSTALDRTSKPQVISFSNKFTTDENNIHINSALANKKRALGSSEITVPISFIEALQSSKPNNSAVLAKGSFDLASLVSMLELQGQKIKGKLNFDTSVKYTQEAIISGNVSLDNGSYENNDTGTFLRNISLAITAEENKFNIKKFSAQDQKTGSISVSGGFSLKQNSISDPDIKILVKNLNAVHRSDFDTNADGQLVLNSNGSSMLLKGALDLFPLNIYPRNLGASSIPQIELTKKEKYPARKHSADDAKPSIPLDLDITINANKQARIIGSSIQAELGGQVTIGGNAAEPQIGGALSIIRGWLEVLGKKFNLEKDSSVKFQGNSIYLDLTATNKVKEKTVTAHIFGYQEGLNFEFTSDPAAPQDEVIANLMFDKSSASLSPMQAVNLGQAINSLRGGGNNFSNPLSQIQNVLNKNNISIGETDSGGMSLGVGRYVTDKVYLELSADSNSKNGNPVKTRTEIELTPKLSIESETGGSSSIGGVGLQWKNDY